MLRGQPKFLKNVSLISRYIFWVNFFNVAILHKILTNDINMTLQKSYLKQFSNRHLFALLFFYFMLWLIHSSSSSFFSIMSSGWKNDILLDCRIFSSSTNKELFQHLLVHCTDSTPFMKNFSYLNSTGRSPL